jgi:pyroglutamyl-peptidase
MSRVLVTAFEPYGPWKTNASWLALVELTRQLPSHPKVTTRLYPVDFNLVRNRLEADLANEFDYAIHLGQAPGSTTLQLESVAINVRQDAAAEDQSGELAEDGPVAYRSTLPLTDWLPIVRQLGVPCRMSYHAGVYLCNATLYWNRYLCQRRGWATRSAFIHVPLDPTQTVEQPGSWPSLPASMVAAALLRLLDELK